MSQTPDKLAIGVSVSIPILGQTADPRPASEPTGTDFSTAYDIEQVRQILPQLIDAIADAVLVVDKDHRVVAANRRYLEVFGAQGGPIAGSFCHDAVNCPIAGPDGNSNSCAACDVVAHNRTHKMLHALPDATGVLRRWEANLNPVADAHGNVTHVVEVWRDITDRSQLEGQLSHSERLASLGMLAAGVAHEINNPMASILAGVESLSRWVTRARIAPEDAAEAREVLELLERETQRSRETTDKLLLLAQPYQLASSWIDLNQALRDTIALLNYQLRKQGIDVVESLDPDVPQIWGRESGIRSICMNLAMNAVQAMPDGGTLTVRTAARSDTVTMEIADTGPGIHPSHLERIWDPFFTTKPPGKGTGLGLSITQRIVEKHGGGIQVRSVMGQGACFILELPRTGPGGEHV